MNKRYIIPLLLALMVNMMTMAVPYCDVRKFSITDGLAANTISDIKQSPDKLMWFATWNGLSYYDGYSFHTFRDEADDVDQRGHTAGLLAHQTPDRLRCDDDHEQNAVQDDVAQAKLALELLLVAKLLERFALRSGVLLSTHAETSLLRQTGTTLHLLIFYAKYTRADASYSKVLEQISRRAA